MDAEQPTSPPETDWGWGAWVSKGSTAILDQATLAGGNFVLNILLARWLPPAEYGAFALVFSFYLILLALHDALSTQPMSVIGPAEHGGRQEEYISWQAGIHLFLAAGAALVIVAAAATIYFFISPTLWLPPLVGVALAGPFMLTMVFLRRLCYLHHRPQLALAGSLTYTLILLPALFLLRFSERLSPFVAFLLLGAASLAGMVVLVLRLRLRFPSAVGDFRARLREAWGRNWRYGRWVAGTAIVGWFSTEAYYALTAAGIGLEATAALRALQNLILPITHMGTALILLLLPWASARLGAGGPARLQADVFKVNAFMVAMTGAFFVFITVFRVFFLELLYAGKYLEWVSLVPLLGLLPLLRAPAQGWRLGLAALQKPWADLLVYSFSAILTLTAGVYAVLRWNLLGAVGAMLLITLLTTAIQGVVWTRLSAKGLPPRSDLRPGPPR